MKSVWTAALCVLASLVLAGPALASLQPDPGPQTAAGVGLGPDSFAPAAGPAEPVPSTDATIAPVPQAVPVPVPKVPVTKLPVTKAPVTKVPVTKPSLETPAAIEQPAQPAEPPAPVAAAPPVEQASEPTQPVRTPAGSSAAAAAATSQARSNAGRTRAEQRLEMPRLPVHLESIRLPHLGGRITIPPVPSVDDADRLVLPAALALLTLVAASGGFLGLVYRLGREQARSA
jgi:outer membrane biosynthesis protein TonB